MVPQREGVNASFKLFTERRSYSDAQVICEEQYQGSLATFESFADFIQVMKKLLSVVEMIKAQIDDDHLWLGNSTVYGGGAGGWGGAPRATMGGFFWEEQILGEKEKCIGVSATSILLAMGDCSEERAFMCMRVEGERFD